ncbi:MAG TPA: sodium:proton antiporter [Candidatus Dietzia intestinigallinarum]|nr:sodium:proton antiporter [Candidatus Dietzia intestinigallinarum]
MDAHETDERGETEAQRIDRNWIELLQELRIVQTGGQVLTGFLLVVPFQDRFADISGGARAVYLVVLALALVSTVTLLAPVMIHRAVFRSHRKDRVLRISATLARTGLAILSVAMIGLVGLIFSMVAGPGWGGVAAAVMAALVVVMLFALPLSVRRRTATTPYRSPGSLSRRTSRHTGWRM